MDTSEKYIDMCRKATEIQAKKPDEESMRAWFYCVDHNRLMEYNNELAYQWCGDWENFHDASTHNVIWLPSQEELYELHTPYTSNGYSAYGLARMFGIWLYAHRDYTQEQGLDSIGQHLLAFVMWEIFDKRWNGSEWEIIHADDN